MCRVLLIDDDSDIRSVYSKLLSQAGYDVETAEDGMEAAHQLERKSFDVILSDLCMPGIDGMAFLRSLRGRDEDIPIILMTGVPDLQSAVEAVEHGAFRYLVKPIGAATMLNVVADATEHYQVAKLKQNALDEVRNGTESDPGADPIEDRFARALDSLWVAFQPIVSWRGQRVFGYEALLRSREPSLAQPLALLDVAEKLGRTHELGRAVRQRVAQEAQEETNDETALFVNLHARDFDDPDLYCPDAPLSQVADRVVLEITERASIENVEELRKNLDRLRNLGFRVAVDDLGTGYAGLSSITIVEPEFVKLDMELIRDVDQQTVKYNLIGAMTRLCAKLGIHAVAEGIQTIGERDKLAELDCDLLQGFLFARPGPPFPETTW